MKIPFRPLQLPLLLALSLTLSVGAPAPRAEESPRRRPNVLFISVDDLRPELGCYGVSRVHTPHIDALADHGTLFLRAYCQQALCAPSRASLMTGLRPETAGVTNLVTHIRLRNPDVVTLSQHFRNHGYHAQSFGKIYHPGLDDPASWSEPAWFPPGPEYASTATVERLSRLRAEREGDRYIPGHAPAVTTDSKTGLGLKYKHPKTIVMGPSTEAPDVPDESLEDGQTVEMARQALHRIKDRPFFLAVGLNRPHLPFVAPKRYWDLYPPDQIRLADNQFPPRDVPSWAMHSVNEIGTYWDITTTSPIPEEKQRELVRGYCASVSYVDALVGSLLRTVEDLNLSSNTLVVLWGDHGYHLGEHSLWCKHTNFEVATRVPLIFSVPGQTRPGSRVSALAELVDVYPTLSELAGLPLPPGLEGKSLAPVIADPARSVKEAAFSQYPVRNGRIGYSMRTDHYRYTEWLTSNTRRVDGVELYDHRSDPAENVNLALRAENAELTATLSRRLRSGWRELQGK